MKHPETYIVTKENGVCPAGPPGKCFYCKQPVGCEHSSDCVCRKKTVVVKFTIDVTVSMPDYWNEKNIHFYYNESSGCKSNILMDIERAGCICGMATIDYIREATPDDDEYFNMTVLKEE